eukprot:CAMPEP_0194226912 /NCGR_PEP_ID=MMETSP0156-20130528/42588_1 /TAXON_ID=33649 /ORGANISM="Thalassionema nitzschioides, Strain L26-B" /LENGTH=433 /DNA_ID=CAMNT_0038959379 /DNA_START=68 /DNA_END=1369 /DNA_ORIENTATION=+
MAASSQQSPDHASEKAESSFKIDSNVAAEVKVPEVDVTPCENKSSQVGVTYESTESSDSFLLAKRLLADGDFDNAMETIGNSIGTIISQLPEDMAAVHESLGPLYYLYGTTLLYSIEESTENLQPTSDDMEEADDSQIAWENLETARLITARMIELSKEGERRKKLELDLSQVHLRLGDLQRANGRYSEAIADYLKCLELRQPHLGFYNRKVADTHYNLGLSYMSLASEGDKQQVKTPTTEQVNQPIISPEIREEYRDNALTHYLEGGKSFAGQIACFCGANPEEITIVEPAVQSGKTTGMDEKELLATERSVTLKTIRLRIATLDNDHDKDAISDLKEIVDEIQEIIDEAESAKKAISEVSEIKAKAQAAAEGDGEVVNADGSTTSIGFGNSTASASVPESAQPMMVVRKKKRPNEDSKMPAKGPSKVQKTE